MDEKTPDTSDWFQKHVLLEFQRINSSNKETKERLDRQSDAMHKGFADVKVEIASLKTQSRFATAMGTGIVSIVVGVITYFIVR